MTTAHDEGSRDRDESAESRAALRTRAEQQAGAACAEDLETLSPGEVRRVIHELRVHQIELEMQNEELRRVQNALDSERARYFDLYNLAPVGYITLSREGLVLEANLAAATLLGQSRAKMPKHRLSEFILPDDQDIYYRNLRDLSRTGEPQSHELRMMRQDGSEFWVRLQTTAGDDPQTGTRVSRCVLSDITDRKIAEKALRCAHDELEQRVKDRTAQLAAKNEELRGFAYTISHDLKSPLRGIAGYAGELDRKHCSGLSDRAQFCVTQIMTAAHNLDRLIENLLKYARLDTEMPTEADVDLRDVVEDIVRGYGAIIAERHAHVTIDVPAVTLRTWELGFAKVLTNLVDNALMYSRNAQPPRVTVRAEEFEQNWRISVADNGVGFDMKYHDRIFGLFSRLVREDEFEGTGAGLAIAKKMVDKLGGRIWAESVPQQGATFFVEIPKTSSQEQPRRGPGN